MAQLQCIGLSWALTKPPFENCAIYFHHSVDPGNVVTQFRTPDRRLCYCCRGGMHRLNPPAIITTTKMPTMMAMAMMMHPATKRSTLRLIPEAWDGITKARREAKWPRARPETGKYGLRGQRVNKNMVTNLCEVGPYVLDSLSAKYWALKAGLFER